VALSGYARVMSTRDHMGAAIAWRTTHMIVYDTRAALSWGATWNAWGMRFDDVRAQLVIDGWVVLIGEHNGVMSRLGRESVKR